MLACASAGALLVISLGGCAALRTAGPERPVRASVPASPWLAEPADRASAAVWAQARQRAERRVVVSVDQRALWLVEGDSVLLAVPVAVGTSEPFEYDGRRYDFTTPVGVRKVLAKATEPIWVPPDWHYFEKAVELGIEPVQLRPGMRVPLEDGTRIEVRERQVGRVNVYGNFWAFTPGTEIIYEGRLFMPPFGTDQRRIPEVLGTHKLEIGDGYLLHGTNEENSIGAAVSHGCVRMFNEDVALLYERVPVGTAVFIF